MTTVAFEGVSVVPMDSERVLDRQTVVVADDQIAFVGPDGEALIPADTHRVDGRGKYLMPGLADMHCHPADEDDLLLCVAHGVTTIRNLTGLPRHVLWREQVAAGQLLGPTIHTSGLIVDGRPVRSNGNLSVVTREEAVGAVERTKRGGYDCVKVYDQLSPDAYRWVVEAAQERDLPVVGHIPFQVGLHGILAAGQRSIEHLYGYPQALQPESRPASAPHDLGQLRAGLFDMAQHAELARIPELAEQTREAGVWNCATLIVRTRWLPGPEALSGLPQMQYLPPLLAAEAQYFFEHYPTEPERFAVPEFNASVLRGLSEAGAGLLVGTDSGVPGIVSGASVHEELQAFVDAGLTPFEALRAATSAPAEFLGQVGRFGQVAVGARADLLLLDANPLADIAHACRLAGVMARGRWLPQAEIADLLADLAARRRQGPTPRRSRAASPQVAPAGGEHHRFRVAWAGHTLGEEEIVVEADPSGDRTISATARMESFGYDVGIYRSEVAVDGAGVDQSGWFDFDADDGPNRVEMIRVGGTVRVRQSEAVADDVAFSVVDPDNAMLFGRPLTPLYARLAERLAGLEVGGEVDVPAIAPGLPPDMSVGAATLHAERLPAVDGDTGARYLVEFRRPNWTTSAVLTCDGDNRPVGIVLGSDMAYWHNNTGTEEPDDASVVRVSRVPSST